MTPKIKELNRQIKLETRDYLVANLFVSEYIQEECDPDDGLHIHVIKAFDKTFIALDGHHFTIDRVWVNKDGTVWRASGQDCPFLPTISNGDSQWYCGDEILEIGRWTEEDVQNYDYSPSRDSKKFLDHTSMMCIPEVTTRRVTEATKNIIVSAYFTDYDEGEE